MGSPGTAQKAGVSVGPKSASKSLHNQRIQCVPFLPGKWGPMMPAMTTLLTLEYSVREAVWGPLGCASAPPGPSAVSALPHKSSVAWACLLFCEAISTRGSGHRADARPGHLGSLPFPAAHTYQYSNSLHSDIRLFQFRIDLRPLSIY